MAAVTGQQEPDGLSDYNRDVVAASLRGIGSPADAHPEMAAVAWMMGCGLVFAAMVGAAIVCGPALLSMVGGAL